MCTHFYLQYQSQELKDIMQAAVDSKLANRLMHERTKPVKTYGEIRPTDVVPVIAPNSRGTRAVFPMQWGFHLPKSDKPLVNARCETAATKPTFKDAWQSHRCIIPASYYFEWEHFKSPDGKVKTGDKYIIQPQGSMVTWLCGLYRIEDTFPVFTVLTREPSEELGRIHDRMPLILPEERIDEWINPDSKPEDLLSYALTDMIMEKATEVNPPGQTRPPEYIHIKDFFD